ncbi:MAG: PH domain-containing protein [Firmicutes bacterium]|nr:PH domain-containing protein [Bacillota bacterium]
MKYKSKVGSLHLILLIVLTAVFVLTAAVWYSFGQWYWFVIFGVFYLGVFMPPFFYTKYEITKTDLVINCGIFWINHKIPLKNILELKSVRGIIDAIALSHDCIEVQYVKGKMLERVLISPDNRQQFWTEINSFKE